MPRPPVPPRPRSARSKHDRLRAACWRGEAPAEALSPADRDELVQALIDAEYSVAEIATHTRYSHHTAGRIVERLKRQQTTTRGAEQ